jgi:hypothetical protein
MRDHIGEKCATISARLLPVKGFLPTESETSLVAVEFVADGASKSTMAH